MFKKLSLKLKMMIFALGIVIFLMILSTLIVSLFIFRQNQQNAYSYLNQSMGIVQEDLRSKINTLNNLTHQIASMENLDSSLQVINMLDPHQELNFVGKETYRTLVVSLYTICRVANVNQAALYKLNGELVGYVTKSETGMELGYPLKSGFDTASLKPGESPEEESWKPANSVEGISGKYPDDIPEENHQRFTINNGYLSLNSLAPVVTLKFNPETNQMEPEQIAFVEVTENLNRSFVDRLSRLTGTGLNVFIESGLSVGSVADYQELDLGMFKPVAANWKLADQKVNLGDLDLETQSYFQALFPIYHDSKCIAAFAALYSTQIAFGNTWQIVRILCFVFLVCILVIIPFSYLFSSFLARPMLNLSELLTLVEDTADFSRRAEIKNLDETGRIAIAFNGLMTSLQEAIGAVNRVMSAVAKGDLSEIMEGDFTGELTELQTHTNDSIEILGKTISRAGLACGKVDTTASQLSQSMKIMADSTMNQAGSIQQISSTLNVVAGQIKANSESAEEAESLSQNTINTVLQGNRQMEEMLQSIKEISETSRQVSNIVKVIDEIAFQTNLLALNAAVEAARAGKYGKGFSVVAEEVRNLANRSANAVKDTANLIEGSLARVEDGVKNADKTAALLNEITAETEKSVSLVNSISVASKEQSRRITETNAALAQLSEAVQTSSTVSEKSAVAVFQLSSQARELRDTMQQFRLKDSSLTESYPVENT